MSPAETLTSSIPETVAGQSAELDSGEILTRWRALQEQRARKEQAAEISEAQYTVKTTALAIDGPNDGDLSVPERLQSAHTRKLAELVDANLPLQDRAALNLRLADSFADMGINFRTSFYGKEHDQWKQVIAYVQTQPDLLAKIPDHLLAQICVDNFTEQQAVIAELQKRIDQGKVLLDQAPRRVAMFGTVIDPALVFVNRLYKADPELYDSLRANWKKADSSLPEELKIGDQPGDEICRQSALLLSEVVKEGQFGEKARSAYDTLRENYPDSFHVFDFRMLREDLLDKFDEKFLLEIGITDDLAEKLNSLREETPSLIDKLALLVKSWQAESGGNDFYRRSVTLIDFLWQNRLALTAVNSVSDQTLVDYAMFYATDPDDKKIKVDLNNDFSKNLGAQIDKQAKSLEMVRAASDNEYAGKQALERYKQFYYQKFFMMSSEEVTEVLGQCYEHWSEVEAMVQDDAQAHLGVALELMASMNNIPLPDWNSVAESYPELEYGEIKELVKKQQDEVAAQILSRLNTQTFRLSSDEMLHLREVGRRLYASTYVEALHKTRATILQRAEEVTFGTHTVQKTTLDDDFCLIVHSNSTGFTMDKDLSDRDYVSSWKNVDALKTHGLSTSFISSENMGAAPVRGDGVLYGFNNLTGEEIFSFSPYDLDSHIANYGFNTGRQQTFVARSQIEKNSVRIYNEFVLARERVKPDCVVVDDTMSDTSRENAYRAAEQWDIPVVEIAKSKLISQQAAKIREDVNVYQQTGDVESLLAAVGRFEANTAGLSLNRIAGTGREGIMGDTDNSNLEALFDKETLKAALEKAVASCRGENDRQQLAAKLQALQGAYQLANPEFSPGALPQTMSLLGLETLITRLRAEKLDSEND